VQSSTIWLCREQVTCGLWSLKWHGS